MSHQKKSSRSRRTAHAEHPDAIKARGTRFTYRYEPYEGSFQDSESDYLDAERDTEV